MQEFIIQSENLNDLTVKTKVDMDNITVESSACRNTNSFIMNNEGGYLTVTDSMFY
jgi:hypothetical protein